VTDIQHPSTYQSTTLAGMRVALCQPAGRARNALGQERRVDQFNSVGRRVCVIGAGIAGLVTAKVLRDDGFDVVVLEKLPTIGGVWAPGHTYPGLRTNSPRETYAFSDFPYLATADDFPTAEQVRDYLDAYVAHFRLAPLLRLATEVCRVSRASRHDHRASSRFELRLRSRDGAVRGARLHCDFVAVCNGVFSQPHVPAIEGREQFAGRVLHSSEMTDPCALTGQRIVVVGAGKSALDCATWAARHCRSCTLVYRAPHWMVPRYFYGRIRADRVIMTRFFELFTRYHSLNRFESFLHGPARAVVRLWWRAQTGLLRRSLDVPRSMLPDYPLPAGFENVGIGYEFYDALGGNSLETKRARIAEFAGPTTILLDTGERVDADVVVFATGWRQRIDFLDSDLRDEVLQGGKFHLYRHILPPREPRVGFIGYASSTACQLTAEIAAHWLSQCFRGELPLPAVSEMDREIARVHAWAAEVFPARAEGYFIGPFLGHYIDELMRDMRLETRRTGDVMTEYFAPLWPSRYRGVNDERRRARRSRSARHQSAEVLETTTPTIAAFR
jgi:dimethylaniline monooxygenase (N-oxide forming)